MTEMSLRLLHQTEFMQYLSPTVESPGHLGLCIDATFWGVGQTEPCFFKMTGVAVSTFYGQGRPSDTILRFYW